MTDEIPKYYLTYIDEHGLRLGPDTQVYINPDGGFYLTSPHFEQPMIGNAAAAVQNKLGLVALLTPVMAQLKDLPRGTPVQLQWKTPNQKVKGN